MRVHRSGDRIVVEIEDLLRSEGRRGVDHAARSAMTRLAQATSFDQLADGLAREVRDLTGFDRVMVYRFDADWNGEVVAEARRDDLNPFLGLHYPATDIPAQARRLYTINPIRLIADIHYAPVPLVPVLDPGTGAPLDLSHASLRSVSPIHVEYLSNMGVTASMSVSIVIDGAAVGPDRLPPLLRAAPAEPGGAARLGVRRPGGLAPHRAPQPRRRPRRRHRDPRATARAGAARPHLRRRTRSRRSASRPPCST